MSRADIVIAEEAEPGKGAAWKSDLTKNYQIVYNTGSVRWLPVQSFSY